MNAESIARVAGRNSRLAAALLIALACAVILLVAGCYSAQNKEIEDTRSKQEILHDEINDAIERGAPPEVVDSLKARLNALEQKEQEQVAQLEQEKERDKATVVGWITLIASLVLPIAGRRPT